MLLTAKKDSLTASVTPLRRQRKRKKPNKCPTKDPRGASDEGAPLLFEHELNELGNYERRGNNG
jgi:hypothetical protein